MSEEIALSVSNLTASYADDPVVINASFDVHRGKLVGIVGPNGAGKSTLIKAIVGAHSLDSGDVVVHGARGGRALARLTYVPQRASVDWDFPVTVRDVIGQGCFQRVGLLQRFSRKEHDSIQQVLEMVGLSELADRQIGELSGGQQQRVFLGRALAQQGEIYLMDEPFAGVDAATEKAIVEVLRALREQGKTVIVVNHDLATVRDYFDELLLLNREVIAYGPTEEVFVPELLQKTYGGRLTILDKSTTLVSA